MDLTAKWTRTEAYLGSSRGQLDHFADRAHLHRRAKRIPAPASGCGLECDKLSKEGAEAHFDAMMANLIDDMRPGGRQSVGRHAHRQLGKRLSELDAQIPRGVPDPPRLRPAAFSARMTGRVVGSLEISERFLWDLRQTVYELVLENYAGQLREMAHGTVCV